MIIVIIIIIIVIIIMINVACMGAPHWRRHLRPRRRCRTSAFDGPGGAAKSGQPGTLQYVCS
eukprot:159108-Karenia_brevis.AAC.1